jgi:hypothetical protein
MATHTIEFPDANIETTELTTTELRINTFSVSTFFTLENVTNSGNTTTEVVQFTNPTTGLVTTSNVEVGGELTVTGNTTVSSNLTVTGDLNVSGALGILDAIYPVGTVIDRTAAITDTHLNGKYKAFLAAPNQEWELVDDGENKVLEKFASVCNTTSLSGRATMQNVTAIQASTTSYVDMSGSVISDFVPPVGTKEIVYTYTFKYHYDGDDDQDIMCKLYVKKDSGSFVEVSKAEHFTKTVNTFHSDTMTLRWVFKVDDADNSDYGSFAAATPSLTFKWQAKGTANDWQLHTTEHNTAYVTPPSIMLECIGGSQILKYERTV